MMQPLYLVGPRGCGKTTIGMALAQATGFRFADTDRWLQSHVQMSVADIVEKEGWGGFRARETAALEAVSALRLSWRREAVLFSRSITDVICTVLA